MIKNLDYATILQLKDEVTYQKGQVVSKTISKSKAVNISLFAFDQDEGLSAHASSGDALVMILDGTAEIMIDEKKYQLSTNQTIILPANIKHALYAQEPFKMLLVVVFDN